VLDHEILSGGNFHGQPVAMALDFTTMALAVLAGIAERRLERLVNPALNESFPAFLSPDPGLHSGLMLAQVTAAALEAETRLWAHPAAIDSRPTSAGKEDYVSMGMGAALKLRRAVDNATTVLAIELMAARHALDRLAPLRPGRKLLPLLEAARAAIPPLTGDRVLAPDIAAARKLLLDLKQ
jgi:histidine ammonia-lyase